MRKMLGDRNPADLMTKTLVERVIKAHMGAMGQEAQQGRAAEGLKL